MKSAYLIIDLLTILFPVALSFDRRVRFVSKWSSILIASAVISLPFLIWDYLFTAQGFWGFNTDYLTGVHLGILPIEEILFFFVVPFACTFIYECCKYYFRHHQWTGLNKGLVIAIPLYGLVLSIVGDAGWYTVIVLLSMLMVLYTWLKGPDLRYVGISFVISLIPFFLVNGILTGGLSEAPIVWYNETQFSGIRLWTIPMEDLLYAFSLIVSVILLFEYIEARKRL